MAETRTPYKRVKPEDVISDPKLRKSIHALDEGWQQEKARLEIASRLAFGLLRLFTFTVAITGLVIIILVVTCAVSQTAGDPTTAIEKMLNFVTTLLPYIATPLGIALGFFFRESRGD